MAINDSCQIYEKNMRNDKMMIATKRVAEDGRTYSECAHSSSSSNSSGSSNNSTSIGSHSGDENSERNKKGGCSQPSGKFIAAFTATATAATKTAAATSSRYMSHCQINAAGLIAANGATMRTAVAGNAARTAEAAAPIMTKALTATKNTTTKKAAIATRTTMATSAAALAAMTAAATTSSDTNTSCKRTTAAATTAAATKYRKPINSWQQQRQSCQQHFDCNRCSCSCCCVRQEQQRKQQELNAIIAHCPYEQQRSCNQSSTSNNGVGAESVVLGITSAVKGVPSSEQQQMSASKMSRKYAKKTMPTIATTTIRTTCAFCLNRLTSDESDVGDNDKDNDNDNCCWHQLLQRKIATSPTATTTAAAKKHDSSSVVEICNNKYNNSNNNNRHLLSENSTKQRVTATTAATRPSCTLPALLCSVLPALREHNWQQLFAVLLLLQLIGGGHISLVWAAEPPPPPLELVNVMLATSNNNDSRSGELAAKTVVRGIGGIGGVGGGGGSGSSSNTIVQGLALGISSSTTTTTTTMDGNKTALTTKTTTTASSTLMTTVRQQQFLQQQQQNQLLASANGSVTAAHPSSSGVIQLINRDAVLQRYNGGGGVGVPGNPVQRQNTAAAARASTCRSCQMREKAKLDSLESIKLHILMRLHLTQLPNITAPIPVPHNIIENFYRNYNATLSKRLRSGSSTGRRTRGRDHAHAHAYHQLKAQRLKKPPPKKQHQQLANAAQRRPPAQDSGADSSFSDEHWHDYSETEEVGSVNRNSDVADMLGDDAQRYQHPTKPELQSAGFYNLNAEHDGAELYDDDAEDEDEEMDEDEYDDDDYSAFYSRVNSVYIFPTFPHLRHNRKSDVLNFKFEHNHATIVRTVIHLYIRGRDWMHEYEPELLHEPGWPSEETRRHIIVSIHRAVWRPNALNFTHTVKLGETRHKIPAGLGQWVQIEVQQLAAHWTEYRNATLSLVVKCQELWMRPFVVTGSDGAQHRPLTVHIEVLTKDQRRRKRSTSLDCQESDHEMRCCRYPLKVNFTNFGWHFVVAPTSFDAYFCNGECKVGYLEQYPHTHIASLTTSATPCCSPTKMSSLNLLYFDNEQNLVLSTIPNMSVEKCSCS